METRHDGSQCNDSRSLDIVVEASDLRPVFVQYSSGIRQAKVLADTCEQCTKSSSMQIVLTNVDMRQGTAFGRTGRICQRIHRTLCHVHAVVEDRGRDHRSVVDRSILLSVISCILGRQITHVCTTVKDNWQRSRWMNARTKGGENEFGNRDQYSSNA